MNNLLRKPLFWTNIAALIFASWLIAGLAFGWTNPSAAPPGGAGAISADSAGNVSWLGSLTGGNVPWPRLTSFPAACPAGQFVSQIGTSLVCGAPAGGLSGSGTANSLTKWISSSSLGNASGLSESGGNLTISGNLIADNNIWGSQTSSDGPVAQTQAGYWGGPVGASWTLTCPAGYYAIGLKQTYTNQFGNAPGPYPRPGIVCAKL